MNTAVRLMFVAAVVASTHAKYVDPYSTAASNNTDCSYVCTDLYEPVCGSDGVTYSNECYLSLAGCGSKYPITKVSTGECPTGSMSTDTSGSTACTDMCPMIYAPVCGSDGQTYGNDCLLGVAQCKSGGVITKVYDGQCPDTSTSSSGSYSSGCPDACIEIYKPVCGSDGVTYDNSCYLAIANCKYPSITKVSDGPCVTSSGSYPTSQQGSVDNEGSYSSSCPSYCNEVYAPVCGCDGVTYDNECELEVASCNHPELHITKVSDSACSVSCKPGY